MAASADAQRSHWLGTDPKNRAENVMIVGLLRNDLGRIREPVVRTTPVQRGDLRDRAPNDIDPRTELRPGCVFPGVAGAVSWRLHHWHAKIDTTDCIAQRIKPARPDCGAIGWVDAPQQLVRSAVTFAFPWPSAHAPLPRTARQAPGRWEWAAASRRTRAAQRVRGDLDQDTLPDAN